MGDEVRAYCGEPPATPDESIDVASYCFKLVHVSMDNRKSGWEKFSFKLPATVRAMYHNDVVYGSDWRALMKDFDDRFDKTGEKYVPPPSEKVPPAEVKVQQLTWDGEPANIEQLLNTYNLECKCMARWGGSTLFLVESKSRMGKTENICEGQAFKLFIASCQQNVLHVGLFQTDSNTSRSFKSFLSLVTHVAREPISTSILQGRSHETRDSHRRVCHRAWCLSLHQSSEVGRPQAQEQSRRGSGSRILMLDVNIH
eukprot:Skav222730  [mRNA]  locus=scaffold2390:247066:248012:+ [translate_table: standard]